MLNGQVIKWKIDWGRKIKLEEQQKSVRREERGKRIKRGIRDKRGRERLIAPEGGLKN